MNLDDLVGILQSEGMEASLTPATDSEEDDRVDVSVHAEGLDEPLILQITPIAKEAGTLEGVELVQFYTAIPVEASDAAAGQLRALLPTVNLEAPLPGFNLHEALSFPYFRYLLMVPLEAKIDRLMAEATWLVSYTLDNLAGEVARVAAGVASAADIIG